MNLEKVKCIVKNDTYEVIIPESFDNAILIEGTNTYFIDKFKTYKIVDKDIDVYWGFEGYEVDTLVVSHHGTILSKVSRPTFQVVIEHLKYYESINKVRLDELVLEKQENEKSELENQIEELRIKKQKFQQKLDMYNKVLEKNKELEELLKKING